MVAPKKQEYHDKRHEPSGKDPDASYGGRRCAETIPPPIDDQDAWRRLLNRLYFCEEDELFRWAKTVEAAVRPNREKFAKPGKAA